MKTQKPETRNQKKGRPTRSEPFPIRGRATVFLVFGFWFLVFPVDAQEARIASDFEIAAAQKQLQEQRDPLVRMAAHLNLGDLYASRHEASVAQTHYRSALEMADRERRNTRLHSDLNGYALSTAYVGLAQAKLGHRAASINAFDEAMRYASDSAKLWNLYSSGMTLLGQSPKAVAAGRRAVRIAVSAAGNSPGASTQLDLAVYRYSLASALLAEDHTAEAEELLRQIVSSLESPSFDSLRDDIARREKFEVFSTTRNDADSYLTLMNRARLRLAKIHEARGEILQAREQLERVLELRSDDPTALTTLARLAGGSDDRERSFADAFAANPFSMTLIREYETYVRSARPGLPEDSTAASRVQRAVQFEVTGRHSEAIMQLEALQARFPENDVIRFLMARNQLHSAGTAAAREALPLLTKSPELHEELQHLIADAEAETSLPPQFLLSEVNTVARPGPGELARLVALIRTNRLTPEARTRLDAVTLAATVEFAERVSATDATTTFERGMVDGIPFRFQQPTEFHGGFAAGERLELEFRVLGVSQRGSEAELVLEPLRISKS